MTVALDALDLTRFGPDAFRSASTLRQAGFELLRESPDKTKILVARHPELAEILVKVFPHQVARSSQLANYERRADGARRIAHLIAEQHFTHLIAAKKRVCAVAGQPVLCVEALPILAHETKARYRDISEPQLRELIFVMATFPGLDAATHNMPFLTDGRIAFIDTEDWQERDWRRFPGLKYLLPLLPRDRRRLAEELWRRHAVHVPNAGPLTRVRSGGENILMRLRRR